jgi:hypothetical protein
MTRYIDWASDIGRPNSVSGHQLPRPSQFALPLDASREAWLIPMDNLNGYLFACILKDLKPNAVVDLRHFRRFDLLGAGPAEPRAALENCGGRYLPFEISFNELEQNFLQSDLASKFNNALTELEVDLGGLKGPLVFLVHAEHHVRLLSMYLESALAEKSKEQWKLKTIR